MLILGSAISTGDSDVFRTTRDGRVRIDIHGTDVDTVTLEGSHDNSTFFTYCADGTAKEFTSSNTTHTADLLDLPGGMWFRLSGGSSTDAVTVRVGGRGVVLV